ncbi:MAG TPA: OsmC family protein [Longimicrobiales bacterium]|nr:OsmC family protein [Longimicrobiales bacterium]
MRAAHEYTVGVEWTGNRGSGTSGYRDYTRDHDIVVAGKPAIAASSDPQFRGDAGRHNPEELLVAALASCHMLWYLHLCADAGVTVTAYRDEASGTMHQAADGGGRFTCVVLRPRVTLATGSDAARAEALHADAHRLCFIAQSVNFPVRCEPRTAIESSHDDGVTTSRSPST